MVRLLLFLLALVSTYAFAGEYSFTIDKHPICEGDRLLGKCSAELNAVTCSYQQWDRYRDRYDKMYSTCRFERYSGEGKYEWFHTNYIPWRN